MLKFDELCIDANDPPVIARFWQEVLGWNISPGDDGEVVAVEPQAGSPEEGMVPALLFCKVPEKKSIKNRLHIDLRPDDQAREVARLENLGAKRVSVGQSEDVTWVVLADPEGNEFCVLRALPQS